MGIHFCLAQLLPLSADVYVPPHCNSLIDLSLTLLHIEHLSSDRLTQAFFKFTLPRMWTVDQLSTVVLTFTFPQI